MCKKVQKFVTGQMTGYGIFSVNIVRTLHVQSNLKRFARFNCGISKSSLTLNFVIIKLYKYPSLLYFIETNIHINIQYSSNIWNKRSYCQGVNFSCGVHSNDTVKQTYSYLSFTYDIRDRAIHIIISKHGN